MTAVDASFWNEVHSEDATEYDWLLSYGDVDARVWRGALGALSSRVLVVGCGSSTLSADLVRAGYSNVVSTDSSPVVVARQVKRVPHLAWRVADVRTLHDTFDAGAFDVILDKACLDAVACYASDAAGLKRAVRSCARVLAVGGRVVSLSCARAPCDGTHPDVDGYGGGVSRVAAAFRDDEPLVWATVEAREVENVRGRPMAPDFADVAPRRYALVLAVKAASYDPQLADYADLYTEFLAPGETHDAFLGWPALRPHVALFVAGSRVLEVGFGSSAVGAAMVRPAATGGGGAAAYVGVDVIRAAVEAQRRRYPDLDLRVADARAADFASKVASVAPFFDVVFDKGTADALLLYADPEAALGAYLANVAEVLHTTGRLLVVSTLREHGPLLRGSGHPRLEAFATRRQWTVRSRAAIPTDDPTERRHGRTFDVLELAPPPPREHNVA